MTRARLFWTLATLAAAAFFIYQYARFLVETA